MKFTVSRQIIIGFSMLVGLCAITGIIGERASHRIAAHTNTAVEVLLPATDLLLQVDRDLQQALVAERSLIFATPGSPQFQRLIQEHGENIEQVDGRWGKFRAAVAPVANARVEELSRTFETGLARWKPVTRRSVEARIADTAEGQRLAIDLTLAAGAETFEGTRGVINELTEILEQIAHDNALAAKRTERAVRWSVIGATLLGIVGGGMLTYLIGIRLSRRVRAVINSLGVNAQETSSASVLISASSQRVADGASEQAAALEETSASLEEMSGQTRQNADNAARAKTLAAETRTAADAGVEHMRAMATAMHEIKDSSTGIAKILKSIDEIAFQTNILALNAAVEAARAGEAGAGFAVVAEEVRALAQRSAKAARETAESVEGSLAKSDRGVDTSRKVSLQLEQIVTRAREMDDLMAGVANASHEQARNIGEVNTAVSRMDQVTQTNAATAEEAASAAAELNAQAGHLHEAVADLSALFGRDTEMAVEAAPIVARRSASQDPSPRPSQTVATRPRKRETAVHAPSESLF